MKKRFGLIGNPLSHSFSSSFFTAKFERLGIDAQYQNYPIADIAVLPQLLLQEAPLSGLNVTIPYKTAVIPYLDELDDAAARIGAVNTIRITDGVLKGYNTDVIGFEESLKPLLQPWHNQALVLGTGGASKAVVFVLQQLGIAYTLVSRTGDVPNSIPYEAIDAAVLAQHTLLINTTPVGTFPDVDVAPAIPYAFLTPQHLLYDLVYNPEETLFLKKGKVAGATFKNGYEMLVLQAEAAWRIWNDL
jgi:shikimate dehydrogenase